jgi:hypothetical protein
VDLRTVYAKTTKGVDEIATRAHKLNMRLRAALIMVNGVDSTQRIMDKVHGMPEIVTILKELERQGFIVEVAPPTDSTAINQMVRTIVSKVHDLLGPDGDSLAEHLEDMARSIVSIGPLVQYLDGKRDVFEGMAGKTRTRLFFEDLHRLPEPVRQLPR